MEQPCFVCSNIRRTSNGTAKPVPTFCIYDSLLPELGKLNCFTKLNQFYWTEQAKRQSADPLIEYVLLSQ